MNEKLCVMCQHFYVKPGCCGYSEYTPGYDATIGCLKDHWEMDNYQTTAGQFRAFNRKAETCADYAPVRED